MNNGRSGTLVRRSRLTLRSTLKAPGTKRLRLKYDGPLSNFGFDFNLRRYILGSSGGLSSVAAATIRRDAGKIR